MGTFNFLLPAGLSPETVRELERTCVIGGPDNMPWPTRVRVDAARMAVKREVDESGSLVAPWPVDGAGRLMSASATLMERDPPYDFQVELARGKINQLRCQASDWRAGGLTMPPDLAQKIRDVSLSFGRAATGAPSSDAREQAQAALRQGYELAEQLVSVYIDQVFEIRQQRQPKLDTLLACRLAPAVPAGKAADQVTALCNSAIVPFTWRHIEPAESDYSWDAHDALVDWLQKKELPLVGGPLIDFGPGCLPEWLQQWDRDLHSIASFMCDFVETVVRRYQGRIRCWRLTAGSNLTRALSLGEDEVLWLTVRLAEAARQIDSGLELIVGVSQPWGDYMAAEERTHSPFIFADTLIRAGLNLAAIDLEWVMGLSSPGSYCRDLLEASRLLDLYALLGVPLEVTLGYPSSDQPDAKAVAGVKTSGGTWRTGFTPAVQADWAASFGALALCKPYIRGVNWCHLSDAEPHIYPHCGLLDAAGQAKPALAKLIELRGKRLK